MADLWSTLLAISFASGLNLYATILMLGLLGRFDLVHLSGQLEIISSVPVIAASALMYAVEFVADKIPFVDSVWDMIHAAIRPLGAAILSYSAVGEVRPDLQMLAALIGGGVALTAHTAKASTRAAANLSPEPFSNWMLSLVEDVMAFFVILLSAIYPLIGLVVVLLLISVAVVLVVTFSRLARRALRRPAV